MMLSKGLLTTSRVSLISIKQGTHLTKDRVESILKEYICDGDGVFDNICKAVNMADNQMNTINFFVKSVRKLRSTWEKIVALPKFKKYIASCPEKTKE